MRIASYIPAVSEHPEFKYEVQEQEENQHVGRIPTANNRQGNGSDEQAPPLAPDKPVHAPCGQRKEDEDVEPFRIAKLGYGPARPGKSKGEDGA